MNNRTALSVFIYVLIAELFFFLIKSISVGKAFGGMTDIFFGAAFALTLVGLIATSWRLRNVSYKIFYWLLLIVSLGLLVLVIIIGSVSFPMLWIWYVLAVFAALIIAILDYRDRMFGPDMNKIEKERMRNEIESLKAALSDERKISESLRHQIEILKSQKLMHMRDGEESRRRIYALRSELEKANKETAEADRKAAIGAKYKQSLEEKHSELATLEKQKNSLKRMLGKANSDAKKQAELKAKYSKTISNIKKAKKADESLLIVSPDGKSVHRPACIAVRNISKENRKLIPSWKEAKKQHYVGCKLCKPDIEKDHVIRNGSKFRFVVSKQSDKVHRTYCTVIQAIPESDRQYLKTYKSAVKKGYTPCRVCNPKQ